MRKLLRYEPTSQARRPGGGGEAFRGRTTPNHCLCRSTWELCPLKRGLGPKEINRFGDTGVQFEAWDFQNIGCHSRIRKQERFFRRFCNKHGFFGDFTPEFIKIHVCLRTKTVFLVFTSEFVENRTSFEMKTRISWNLRIFWHEDLFLFFFFFRSSSQSSWKFAWNIFFVWSTLTNPTNKLFVPSQNLFMPPP